MTTENMLADMAAIDANSEQWVFEPQSCSYTLQVGMLTLDVRRASSPAVNAIWSVRHEQEGILIQDIPADHLLAGRREAIDWSRRWLSQHS